MAGYKTITRKLLPEEFFNVFDAMRNLTLWEAIEKCLLISFCRQARKDTE